MVCNQNLPRANIVINDTANHAVHSSMEFADTSIQVSGMQETYFQFQSTVILYIAHRPDEL